MATEEADIGEDSAHEVELDEAISLGIIVALTASAPCGFSV